MSMSGWTVGHTTSRELTQIKQSSRGELFSIRLLNQTNKLRDSPYRSALVVRKMFSKKK